MWTGLVRLRRGTGITEYIEHVLISSFRRYLCTEMQSAILKIVYVTEYNLIERSRNSTPFISRGSVATPILVAMYH
jgi:hypothetical protein